MRVWKSGAVLTAVTVAFGMGVTACGDSGSDNDGVNIFTVTPEKPLIPGDTTEAGGGRVNDSIYSTLVDYDPETSEPRNEIAESIESENNDAQHYTIKIKKGWKFHDSTEVKAKNFVDTWNYVVYTPNAQSNASFFSSIEGYDQAHTIDPDEDGPQQAPTPETDKMSGLELVDDYTFKVNLSEPFSVFPTMLGYRAFSPLPDVYFQDPAAFAKKPIGTGPFKFVSQDTKKVALERFDDFKGEKAKVEKLNWVFYSNDVTAYRDIRSGKLDFMEQIPLSTLASYQDDFKGQYSNKDIALIQIINFPTYDPKYQDPNLRKAFSMAVNRDEIAKEIFDGTRTPATGYVNPVIPGYKKDVCGQACEYNPDEAKRLFDQSGASKSETYEVWYNADGGHKDWMEAVAADISETLGITVTAQGTEQFADVRTKANTREFTQMYRAGWQADYPALENYLNPLYKTGGSSNDNGFSDPAVDAKLNEASATANEEDAIKLYQEAEKMVAEQMPGMPMFYVKQQSVWSDNVKNVVVDWKGEIDVQSIELK